MQTKDAKVELWKQRRERHRKSGLSRKAFCAKYKLRLSRLDLPRICGHELKQYFEGVGHGR